MTRTAYNVIISIPNGALLIEKHFTLHTEADVETLKDNAVALGLEARDAGTVNVTGFYEAWLAVKQEVALARKGEI